MVFEEIENLKQEYTDKYVVVDETRPELRRFRGQTGQVKTVNMSGRALVQFDAHENIGWYDIEVDYLRVVDKPPPKEPEKKAAKTPQEPAKSPKATTKASAATMSAADVLAAARGAEAKKPAAAKPQGVPSQGVPSKMSVADVLAAARGGKSTGAGEAGTKPPVTANTPETAASPAAQKRDAASMSVAEVLAAARGVKSGATSPAKPAGPPKPTQPEVAPKPAPTKAKATSTSTGGIDTSEMTVEQMLAAARSQKGVAPRKPPVATPVTSPATSPAAAAAEPAVSPAATAAKPRGAEASPRAEAAPSGKDGPLPTKTAEIIDWCRQHDRNRSDHLT